MSDGEDLFDEDFEERQPGAEEPAGADLFDDEEGGELQEELLEDEGVAAEEPSPASAPAPKADRNEMRMKLQQLARKHKAAADGGEPAPKKKRKDRGDKGERGSSRPQRLRRQGGDSPEAGGSRQAAAAYEEVPEDQIQETEADQDFIDDDGVAEEDRYEEDTAALLAAEEAEEAAPGDEDEEVPTNIIDEVLHRRKRAKRRDTDQEVTDEVMSLVSMMTACAEKDASAMEAKPPQPAIDKLKALGNVGSTLRQRKYHEMFLATKGLNAMAAWLRPYSNGTLPNAKVRGELVDLLALLALDTTNDYVRERLEESELGKIIMFYYKNPNESMPLRSKCRDLIQAWSAPIFADNDEELRKRRQRERAHRQRQAAERADRERQEQREAEEAERRRKMNPKEKGFRQRASVPQPSKMDFVINPGSRMDPLDASLQRSGAAGGGGSAAAGGKANALPIGGKLGKVLQQRKRGPRDRMGGMSVEGRGIQM
uniref:TFIIS N-terminal domain-containing protein n=1 Tax=Tetradesmus obliquus TaxID=3088 RepID=A0A383WE56_TETOB|eukprot:jgi/Sobl393_1/1106/SZX72060.1